MIQAIIGVEWLQDWIAASSTPIYQFYRFYFTLISG
jgi:hypothetical protein